MDITIVLLLISWGYVGIIAIITKTWCYLNPPEPMTAEEEIEWAELEKMAEIASKNYEKIKKENPQSNLVIYM